MQLLSPFCLCDGGEAPREKGRKLRTNSKLEPPPCRKVPTLPEPASARRRFFPTVLTCVHRLRRPRGAVEPASPGWTDFVLCGTFTGTLTPRPTFSPPKAPDPLEMFCFAGGIRNMRSRHQQGTDVCSLSRLLFPAILFYCSRLHWLLEQSDTGPEETENRLFLG